MSALLALLETVDPKVNLVVQVFLVIRAILVYLEDLENPAELDLPDLLVNPENPGNRALKVLLEMIQLVAQV